MILRLIVLFLAVITLSDAYPTKIRRKRDANFWAVRTKLVSSKSGASGDPVAKYFHEAVFHPHYDGRFADKPLDATARRKALVSLLQSYLSTMHDIGAQTWIMHGTLMGWWWNRKILPWDSDIDVQMSESSMDYIAKNYNMTLHHYRYKDGRPGGKDYLLEINPNYVNGSIADYLNMIDARWIDTDTGLFIDITTLRKNLVAEALGVPGMMMCKDKHQYRERDIYPLRASSFEGVDVMIPYAYTDLLEEEYGKVSLVRTNFEGHHFDQEKREWIPNYTWSRIPPQTGWPRAHSPAVTG